MTQCDFSLMYELTSFPERFEGLVDALSAGVVTAGIMANSFYPNAGNNDKSCSSCQKK